MTVDNSPQQPPICDHVLSTARQIFCRRCGTIVPSSGRAAARLRGRHSRGASLVATTPLTLPPGRHDVTVVHRDKVSTITIDIRPRRHGEVAVGDSVDGNDTTSDIAPTAASSHFVAEVVAVKGDTIFPVGHVVAVGIQADGLPGGTRASS